ncbi:MAG: flagellar export chaperone FlgN [Deltaproteobacteria bacterium]|nr:flagellar export chaperone FlgN [Deltaproteobacteria bacterium]
MKRNGSTIETLFHEKILLYRDLLETLKQEKESIFKIDVDALWRISDKKQRIASEIKGARQKILDELTKASIPHGMDIATFQAGEILSVVPSTLSQRLRKVHVILVSLKNEIQNRLEENKEYVGEYLSVLDELIGIITDAGTPKPVYGKNRCPEALTTNLFIHREV